MLIEMIDVDEYPELALLAWNRLVRQIRAEDAFALYENNWRFIDPEKFTQREADLLNRLKTEFGHGVLNV